MTMVMQMQRMIQSELSTIDWVNILDLQKIRTFFLGKSDTICVDYEALHSIDAEWYHDLEIESLYMKKIHLTLLESLILYFCFGVSLLSYIYASFLLLESLVHFGLRRCRRKLTTWKNFVQAKHLRL